MSSAMGRKGRSITISLSDEDKARLEAIALEYGMTWGDRANISELVKAIARKKLKIAPNHDWTAERIVMLNTARCLLDDAGKKQDAIALAELLCQRNELTIPMRRELELFIERDTRPWRIEVERYINRNCPFQLSYQDPRDRIFQFNIYYAKIVPRDDREYLDCWCAETDGNTDLPELAHNRTLRLDRIMDAAIAPMKSAGIKRRWQEGLDTVQAEMNLYGGLAFAYHSKKGRDVSVAWLAEDSAQILRVVRNITSSFWFMRNILPYGADCEVIRPLPLRERVQVAVLALAGRYENS